MPAVTRLMTRGRYLLLPVLAVGFLVTAWAWEKEPRPQPRTVRMDDWDIADLAGHLRENGLELHAVATRQDGVPTRSAFLAATDRDWQELNGLPKAPDYIDLWQGALYVERGPTGTDWTVREKTWGDCCLVADPFVFFGDQALLTRVRAALTASGPQ